MRHVGFSHLIQMDQEGDIAPKVSSQFAVFRGQQESFWRADGALLFYSSVHLFHSFCAVVQHNFTVSLERKCQQLKIKPTHTKDKALTETLREKKKTSKHCTHPVLLK